MFATCRKALIVASDDVSARVISGEVIRQGSELVVVRRTPMHAFVEDQPCLTIRAVRLAGGFAPSTCWAEIEGGRFKVRWLGESLQVSILTEAGGWRLVEVGLQIRPMPRGQDYYFLCPLSGAPVLKLFILSDQLGSAKALGLRHLSQARPKLYEERRRRAAQANVDPFATYFCSTEDGWQGTLSAEVGVRAMQSLASWVRRARSGGLVSDRSKSIWGYGFAAMQPQLDIDDLVRLGIVEEGLRHVAIFSWRGGLGGVDRLVVASDLVSDQPPILVLAIFHGQDIVHQAVFLEKVEGRWVFICPVTGERVSKLYACSGRFAGLTAQYLVLGRDRPDSPDPDTPLVQERWWTDKPGGEL